MGKFNPEIRAAEIVAAIGERYVHWGRYDEGPEDEVPDGYAIDFTRTVLTDTGYIAPLVKTTHPGEDFATVDKGRAYLRAPYDPVSCELDHLAPVGV